MLTILLSLVFLSTSFLVTVLSANYAVYMMENKKVNNLAKKASSISDAAAESMHTDRQKVFAPQSFSIEQSVSKKRLSSNGVFQNTLTKIGGADYKEGFKKFIETLRKVQKGGLGAVKTSYMWVINTLKPMDETTYEEKQEQKRKQVEAGETIEKVISIKSEKEVEIEQVKIDEEKQDNTDLLEKLETKQEGGMIMEEKEQKPATIGIEKTAKLQNGMTIFEKLETRVLSKLQDVGMEHYDIWLELGDLYVKFDHYDKAKEIYALVLKHADGRIKEMARNKLIGLS